MVSVLLNIVSQTLSGSLEIWAKRVHPSGMNTARVIVFGGCFGDRTAPGGRDRDRPALRMAASAGAAKHETKLPIIAIYSDWGGLLFGKHAVMH